jgi:hypothetical protein
VAETRHDDEGGSSQAGAYGLLLIPVLLMVGLGVWLGATGRGWGVFAAGCASGVALGIAVPLLRAIESSRNANLRCINEFTAPFNERMQQMNVLLNLISEQQLISDRTKQLAYRTRDRDALRRAIHEEIANHDWEAAMLLAGDMEDVFGYKQEADQIRREIDSRRSENLRKQVGEAMAVIERHMRAEKWQEALAEAHRASQTFPSDEQAHNLPAFVEERRVQHKRQLMEGFREAIGRHDNDGAIEILRKLDPYLTPQEAEGMQETARNLFKEKLNSLRTQFSLAVTEHNGHEALRLGEIIVRDFPNTRIAQEVRETMPSLREKAAQWQHEQPEQPAAAQT